MRRRDVVRQRDVMRRYVLRRRDVRRRAKTMSKSQEVSDNRSTALKDDSLLLTYTNFYIFKPNSTTNSTTVTWQGIIHGGLLGKCKEETFHLFIRHACNANMLVKGCARRVTVARDKGITAA